MAIGRVGGGRPENVLSLKCFPHSSDENFAGGGSCIAVVDCVSVNVLALVLALYDVLAGDVNIELKPGRFGGELLVRGPMRLLVAGGGGKLLDEPKNCPDHCVGEN